MSLYPYFSDADAFDTIQKLGAQKRAESAQLGSGKNLGVMRLYYSEKLSASRRELQLAAQFFLKPAYCPSQAGLRHAAALRCAAPLR